jgi:RNA polymerase subunit RPABC4/transcription elongation factor Spt4
LANTICRICGKLFARDGNQECPECHKKDSEDYKTIREYISTHRNVTAVDVNVATGIPISTILRFIKDGRVELMTNVNRTKTGKIL